MKKLLLLAVLLAVAAGLWFYVIAPYGPQTETFVDIPAGTSSAGIAARLEGQGILRSRYSFLLLRRWKRGTLHAGEYRFDRALSPAQVYDRIERGDVYTRLLVIPEGFNIYDIAQAVEQAGLGDRAGFLAAEQQETGLIRDLSPQAASLEGFLFPDSYRFPRHITPAQMLAVMVRRFRQVSATLGLPGAPDLARVVTIASLVEKEVRVDAERPLVAGVFVNRLAARMPLATDPSVIYAALLAGRWRGVIHRSDLDFDSPYNTYRHAGLPPGPIANPGVAALKAAMHPAQTDYLYFVADARGHSRFSVDLAEHTRQTEAYRQAMRPQPLPAN